MKNKNLIKVARAMLRALRDLLGDVGGDVFNHRCVGCGRHYPDLPDTAFCGADDCPRHVARKVIARATRKSRSSA